MQEQFNLNTHARLMASVRTAGEYVQSVTYGGSGAGNWNARKFQVPWPSHVFMSKTRSGLCYKEDDSHTKDTKDTMAELNSKV